MTFAFGLVEVYDIYQILRGREITTEANPNAPKWMQIANKVIIVCAKISLILSAATSPPGVFIISTLVGCVFSTVQLERVFGPNTIFAINPWHPRHVVSIASVILAMPIIIQSVCKGVAWAYKKISQYHEKSSNEPSRMWLTDAKLRLMVFFNTITSRPVLHTGNQLSRYVFCRA